MFCFEKGNRTRINLQVQIRNKAAGQPAAKPGQKKTLWLRELTYCIHDDRAVPGAQDARSQGSLFADGLIRFGLVPVIGPARAAQPGIA